MEMLEKNNKKLENTKENPEMELENILTKLLNENNVIDIAVERKLMKILSKNESVVDNNQQIDEDLDSHRKFEFLDLEDVKVCENPISDGLICNDVLLESDESELSYAESDISNSSSASESSFVVLESEGCVQEEFECSDILEEENGASLKELNIPDDKITVDEFNGKKETVSSTKQFDDNVKLNNYGSSEQVQKDLISLPMTEDEIKEFKEEFIKCFLKKIQNRSQKRERRNLKENLCSPKLDRNETVTEKCKTSVENSGKTCADTSSTEYCACDCYNEMYHHLNPNTVEWGLNTFEIKPNGHCSIQSGSSNSTENHPFDNNVAPPVKIIEDKNRNTEYSHRSKNMSNIDKTRTTERKPFKNNIRSSRETHVVEKEKDEECCCKKHKKPKIKLSKTNAQNNLSLIRYAASSKAKKENEGYIPIKSKKQKLTPSAAKNSSFINYATPSKTSDIFEMEKKEEYFRKQNMKSNHVKKREIDGKTYFTTDELKRRFMAIGELRRRKERQILSSFVILLLIHVFVTWLTYSYFHLCE